MVSKPRELSVPEEEVPVLSGCDAQKSLAMLDFAAAPGVNRSWIQELGACAFVARHENLLLCGPTGVG